MGDVGGAPGFGQIDLDIEDEPNASARPPTATAKKPSQRGFGEVELDLGDGQVDEAPPPPSTSRVFGPAKSAPRSPARGPARSKRPTEKTVARTFSLDDAAPASVHDESTRIVSGDALSAITRPPPANPLQDDGNTRAWNEIDQALLSVGDDDDAPPSSRNSGQASGSGVASRDGRVAAMRELYAKGDADGALALAASLGDSMAPSYGADHPDASVVVEFGEQSIDLLDPFGGLIPMDDDLASTSTVVPPSYVAPRTAAPPPPPAAHLTLTERQSIPRLLKSMAEVSKLKIDHRAGFLLAHVDGNQTLEEILDICAMPSAEALALIASLKEMGVIEFE